MGVPRPRAVVGTSPVPLRVVFGIWESLEVVGERVLPMGPRGPQKYGDCSPSDQKRSECRNWYRGDCGRAAGMCVCVWGGVVCVREDERGPQSWIVICGSYVGAPPHVSGHQVSLSHLLHSLSVGEWRSRAAAILVAPTPVVGPRSVGVGFLAVRPRRESSLSNYRGWLRQGGLPPPPSEGGRGADTFPSSASPLSAFPPLSPCSFLDNEGEGDTRGHLKSSLSVSPSTLGPSEGGVRVTRLLIWMPMLVGNWLLVQWGRQHGS